MEMLTVKNQTPFLEVVAYEMLIGHVPAIFGLKILRKIFTGRLLFESDRC
jgi:hypothetical protein